MTFEEFFSRVKKRYAEFLDAPYPENRKPYPEDIERYIEIRDFFKSARLPDSALKHFVDYYYGLVKQSKSLSTLGMVAAGENQAPPYVVFSLWYKRNYYRLDLEDDDCVFNLCWSIRVQNEQARSLKPNQRELEGRFGDECFSTRRKKQRADEEDIEYDWGVQTEIPQLELELP
jgi:hypothetical protein